MPSVGIRDAPPKKATVPLSSGSSASPSRKLGRGQQLPWLVEAEKAWLAVSRRAGALWRGHDLPQLDQLQLLPPRPEKASTWAVHARFTALLLLNYIESQR